MYCCAHKTATLNPIEHTVPYGTERLFSLVSNAYSTKIIILKSVWPYLFLDGFSLNLYFLAIANANVT